MKLPREHPRARVEMLPLLDIIFLILVFFIYAMLTMSVDKAMPVKLPGSTMAAPLRQEAVSLSITGDGSLYLDKLPVSSLNLIENLRLLAGSGKEDLSVKVFADAGLSYQKLYQVLDMLKEAGISSISLQAGSGRESGNANGREGERISEGDTSQTKGAE